MNPEVFCQYFQTYKNIGHAAARVHGELAGPGLFSRLPPLNSGGPQEIFRVFSGFSLILKQLLAGEFT